MALLKVGIVGCGRISAMYAGAFSALRGEIEVAAACDIRIERARAFAEKFPGCRAVGSFEEILSAGIDVLHIATPHFLHEQMAIDALNKGIHVLLEKPMAISMAGARNVLDAAQKSTARLGVIFQTRYMSAAREMKRVVSSGGIGAVTGIWSTMHWWRPPSYYECDWKGSWAGEGGGVLIDQAIHTIDLALWASGMEAVWAHGKIYSRILTSIEVEDTADAVCGLTNGALYSLYATNCFCQNDPIQLRIMGENGSLHLVKDSVTVTIDGKESYTVADTRPTGGATPDYWGNYHEAQLKDFYGSIRTGAAIAIDGAQGLKALKLILMIYESSRADGRVYAENFG